MAVHSMARWLVYLAARYLSRAARWKAEQDSADFRGMTGDSPAAHSPDDCSSAEERAHSGAGLRSSAARWKAERESADFRGMTGDSSAAHSPDDCSTAQWPV